jgi:radical SAM superfamily enzyme with C-terminal helix-hairpin-helix motif
MSSETGTSETPTPNVKMVTSLLKAINEKAEPEIFHLDNANPAVIAEHPAEAREITKAIAEHCTSGNVLAFGQQPELDLRTDSRSNTNRERGGRRERSDRPSKSAPWNQFPLRS